MSYVPSYVQQYLDQQVPLDRSWPGLEPRAGEVEVDPDALDTVGNQLLGEGDGGDGITPEQLEQRVNQGNGAFGMWPTAGYMQHSLQTAGGSIAFYFRRVLEQVEAAAVLFRATAEDYRQIDQGAAASLEAHAAGWDRLAAQVDTNVEPAGEFRDSTKVPYISQYEDVSNYDADWIASEMERIKAAQSWTNISDAGTALDSTAGRLQYLASSMRGLSTQINGQWSSETAAAAQRALQRIASTANDLAEKAQKTATFAHESAGTLQRAAQGFSDDRNLFEKGVDAINPFGDSNKDAMRREALEVLNENYRDVNYTTLPSYVNADLPELPPAGRDRYKTPTGPGGSGGSGGSGGYIPPSSPNMPPPPAAPAPGPTGLTPAPGAPAVIGPGELGPDQGFDGGGIPDDAVTLPGDQEWSNGGDGGLAGGPGPIAPGGPISTGPAPGPIAPGPGGPIGAGPAPGPIGAGPGGPIGAGPGLVPGTGTGTAPGRGAAGGGPGRVGPGGTTAGRPGMPGGAPGAGGRPAMPTGAMPAGGSGAGSARGAGGAGGPGAGGRPGMVGGGRPGAAGAMPMGGARRGEGDDEGDDRNTWLMEDEDPWHGDENVPPPIIR